MSIFSKLANHFGLADDINRLAVNTVARATEARPRAYSLWSHEPATGGYGPFNDYTSWPGLTDRSFSGRHLSPADPATTYPHIDDIVSLFMRPAGAMKGDRSSALFMFFAQWFTDSVLRVDALDRRKNTSNHDIDLCQIYGLTEKAAGLLRSRQLGKLRSQLIGGEEYLEYLYEQTGAGTPLKIRSHFADLHSEATLDAVFTSPTGAPVNIEVRRRAYATGLERGNSTLGYVAISTLFLREHNRLCEGLHTAYPAMDDEQLFQTARMINIVLLMKVVVEDYINHIAGRRVFMLDSGFAENERWYRTNWIAIEFDLLYRWHSLVPDRIDLGGGKYTSQILNNNELFEKLGLSAMLNAASRTQAGQITLFNTPMFLKNAEHAALKMSRTFRLRSYNDYRQRFNLPRLEGFEDLNNDPDIMGTLMNHYPTIDDVELLPGLFAEKADDGALFGDLLNIMVAYDAFTQIYTNPLLAKSIYHEGTFTKYGMQEIARTHSVADIARRNCSGDVVANLGFNAR